MFRRATITDADDIVKIYNQAMKPGVFAINQITPDTRSDRVAWLREHQDPYPVFVYEIERRTVIGWCSLSKFSVRPEYTGVAEISRYIDENHRGKGLGGLMLTYLIEAASGLGLRLLVSNAYERNIGSIKSVNSHFRCVAVFHEVARVHGEWQNVAWFWKKLR
ncbi:phosphinothricin acetyltransferase [Bradyrhizobium sp. USDA 4532]|uniref:GNAT family N-acetyltransferase n=1 Tax=unclassified Bradyrhizobium TaxID=2631580 RepID=UPI00209C8A18|nr:MULTISPECIES: GNAT family N-acetyltransferase [unclassified Bradyrhizobium]MCP1835499.1 phosphinothricin acetyltransferase [Bradyrhizobium sp. USDA 4545]MCP1920245.1 phosphinothricin acetyltransferase [Bradyrhizobium sp. USDA 4532]